MNMNKSIKFSIGNYAASNAGKTIDVLSIDMIGMTGATAGAKTFFNPNHTTPVTIKGSNFINNDGTTYDPPREHQYGEMKIAPDKNGIIYLPNKWSITYFLSSDYPKFKCNLKELRNLDNLTTLALYNQDITGDIANLSNLSKLTTLILKGNLDITGDIAVIDNFPSLTRLTLEETDVYGDVAHILDKGLDITSCLYGNRVYGCLSDAGNDCVYSTAINNTSEFTWTANGRNGSDKKALILHFLKFSNAQNAINYLLDTSSNTPLIDNKCTGVRSAIELYVADEKYPYVDYILPMSAGLITAMRTILSWTNYNNEPFTIKVHGTEYKIVNNKLTAIDAGGNSTVLE